MGWKFFLKIISHYNITSLTYVHKRMNKLALDNNWYQQTFLDSLCVETKVTLCLDKFSMTQFSSYNTIPAIYPAQVVEERPRHVYSCVVAGVFVERRITLRFASGGRVRFNGLCRISSRHDARVVIRQHAAKYNYQYGNSVTLDKQHMADDIDSV